MESGFEAIVKEILPQKKKSFSYKKTRVLSESVRERGMFGQ